MKLPKETNRYCPKCRKHTAHKIETAKQKSREKARGLRGGTGNLGKRSKPAVKSWKRKTKVTRRIALEYKCSECGKKHQISKAIRAGRIEIGEKVAK
jgi:large subunit ribosomal protein L44e